jgi:hypothetical protein
MRFAIVTEPDRSDDRGDGPSLRPRPAPGTSLRRLAVPAVPAAVACVIGLFQAGHRQLWLDESITLADVSMRPSDLLSMLGRVDAVLGPYYLSS